jgi:dienelactone hydrolase
MFRRYWSYGVDELAGYFILRLILRHGGHPPLQGQVANECPGFDCGEIARLYSPTPAPLDLHEERQPIAETATCTVYDSSFPSAVVTPFEENNLVRVRHWESNVPVSGPRMTVVGVDGIVQMNSGWFRRLADELTPAGFDVVMMDSPYNFRRTPEGYRPGQLILRGDMEHQFAVSRQAVLDLWTVIQSLQQNPNRQVGLVGISYGGWVSLMASLLAEHLKFVVAIAPPVDILKILEEGGRIVVGLQESVGLKSLDTPELVAAARGLSPLCWEPRLDRRQIVLYAARYDRFVPPHRIEELAERWDSQLRILPAGHIALTTSRRYIPTFSAEVRRLAGSAT